MIYLDYSATTPLDSEVFDAMKPYYTKYYGNASSLYRQGQIAREALDDARFTISKCIECHLEEIIFTSGATESNNMAIKGVVSAYNKKNPEQKAHVITSALEHSSVRNVLHALAENGTIELTEIPVNTDGCIDPDEVKNAILPHTALVSVIAVNNEIGSIQPISRIGRICEKKEIPFHVDAVQALGNIHVSCEYWKCDLLSLSAHKFYGPKGVGVLYVRSGTELDPLLEGGGQERSYRGGTENIAGVVGLATALEKAVKNQPSEYTRLQALQTLAKQYIETELPFASWNGAEIGEYRSPSNLNFSFSEIDGESMLMRLDLEGVAVSLGSACSSGLMKPSHVITALGKSEMEAKSSLRLTLGKYTSEKEIQEALEKIKKVVHTLRSEREFF